MESAVLADDPTTAPTDTGYGLFNWLDHRSVYGQGVFPEPFLVDDTDLEVNEARFDWLHTEAHDQRSDVVKAELEKGFGLLTLEIEVPYEIDTATAPDKTTDGFDSVSLGARYPIHQFVSDSKLVDSTFGVALEVGIPTHTSFSKDTEVVPKLFDDLRLGEHVTVQSIFGLSMLYGSDSDNGLKTFEYGFVFGYTIAHKQLALPDVLQFIPVFELKGETELNKDNAGHNSLTGNAGFRVDLKTIGPVQPRLGVGYVFPINENARENLHWGSSPAWCLSIESMTPEPDSPARMNRRQFLMLTAAALVTGCQTAIAADKSTHAPQERVVNAGPVSKYAADGVYTGFIDQGFFIVHKANTLTALSSFCTHRKCKLTAESDRSFYCPCHGSTFASGGKVAAGPATRDLPTLPSFTNEKGELFVRVPDL